MKKSLPLILLMSLVLVLAPSASATTNPGPVTPLENEPLSLHVDPDQFVFEHRVVPQGCTVLTNGNCAESIEVWLCPAGRFGDNPLSADARARLAPSYNLALVTTARAYRDTHCQLDRFIPRAAPTATPTAALNPTACPDGSTLVDDPNLGLVCRFENPSVPATPAPPELAFTGSETTVLGYLGLGLVGVGASLVGARRRTEGRAA